MTSLHFALQEWTVHGNIKRLIAQQASTLLCAVGLNIESLTLAIKYRKIEIWRALRPFLSFSIISIFCRIMGRSYRSTQFLHEPRTDHVIVVNKVFLLEFFLSPYHMTLVLESVQELKLRLGIQTKVLQPQITIRNRGVKDLFWNEVWRKSIGSVDTR